MKSIMNKRYELVKKNIILEINHLLYNLEELK